MRRIAAAIPALALLALVTCDTPSTAPTTEGSGIAVRSAKNAPSEPKIKSVSVSPASASITVGSTRQLTATSKPSAGSFTWTSSNNTIATVSASGLVTGVAAGSASITASAGGKSASAAITVTAPTPPPPPPPPAGAILLAAGDISTCSNNNDEATARLLDAQPQGLVAILGDNVYESGTATEFANCYDPTWGRHKSRTKPSAGNHEYNTAGASGYYGYFGSAAGDPAKGYYSYDHGDWHIIVLNTNVPSDSTSAQAAWLRADLTANAGKLCTLAYWHHPRFSSGEHGNNFVGSIFWGILYEFNADVILGGHDHHYERFAPQTPAGVADASRGIREFVVGTGGRSHYPTGTLKPNSQVANSTTYGVLKLTLSASSYSWQFIPVAGQTFTDTGTTSCH